MANQKLVPYVHEDGKIWDRFFVDVKSQVIYFEAKINGKRIKFSTKEKYPNGNKAKKFANKELDDRLGRRKVLVRNTISEELDLYLKVKNAENLSYFTVKSYQRSVEYIREFWGDKLPTEINRDTLTEWYTWWYANKTITMEDAVKWMRNFCRYLSEKVVGGFPVLPAVPRIKDPKQKQIDIARTNKKERIISTAEFNIIYKSAPSKDQPLPDWVLQILVLFMYTMATRIDETLNLDFETTVILDDEIPKYCWFAGQNKADRVGQHALPSKLIEPLIRLRELRRSEGTAKLFPQQQNNQVGLREQQIDWDEWREKANIGWHWTPHTFRHTCLTNVLNDARVPQLIACKQYRVSPKVALKTYLKTKPETMLSIKDVIEVNL